MLGGTPHLVAMCPKNVVVFLGTWQHAPEHGIVGLLQVNFFIIFYFPMWHACQEPGNVPQNVVMPGTCPRTWHNGAAAG